jgi:hypothetical protein
MHDHRIRLSADVVQKAEVIAAEWGLKNARAAVEAVFRRYADEYLYGRLGGVLMQGGVATASPGTLASPLPKSANGSPELMPNRIPSMMPSSFSAASLNHAGISHAVAASGMTSPMAPGFANNLSPNPNAKPATCEALDALDDLLAL